MICWFQVTVAHSPYGEFAGGTHTKRLGLFSLWTFLHKITARDDGRKKDKRLLKGLVLRSACGDKRLAGPRVMRRSDPLAYGSWIVAY
jgi:hypothetical protein